MSANAGPWSTATPATPSAAAPSRREVSGSPGRNARARSATHTGNVANSTADSPDGVHCWAMNISAYGIVTCSRPRLATHSHGIPLACRTASGARRTAAIAMRTPTSCSGGTSRSATELIDQVEPHRTQMVR